MNGLDNKINTEFPGLVVRKDLVKAVKGNAIVPSYVLEYLLGQYCATSDEASIQSGIETVKEILRKHYVHRNEANLIRSEISRKGRLKVIDKITVNFNSEKNAHEATFSNLAIKKVLIDADTVKKHRKLLVGGVWCICDVEYLESEDKGVCPWVMNSIKPIQLSHFDHDQFVTARSRFSTDEWIDLLIQTIGFDPEKLSKRAKMLQLVRLISFCERNYNVIELGPKGKGKSHIYSEFSPHGILISGGEVTVAKLFVNNSSGKIGLVGYWDVVTFDEFAGQEKKVDKALVDILKNYMANKSFSRGVDTQSAEASMSFVGNTKHNLPYMLKHSDLFDELPSKFKDSAFLDRLHCYIPGWEVDILRGELFSTGYGFVVDYLAEVLKTFRNHDFSNRYQSHFELSSDISTRDRDGIHKTFSGLMKILFPHEQVTKEEIEEVLRFSMEGRKRIKDQLMRIDTTYERVRFNYTDLEKKEERVVKTLEEEQYPLHYYKNASGEDIPADEDDDTVPASPSMVPAQPAEPPTLEPKHLEFQENHKGATYDTLFGDYLRGASRIVLTDPYIRLFYQIRNLMEFVETAIKVKAEDEELHIHLVTVADEFKSESQIKGFEQIQENCAQAGVQFSWGFDNGHIHARHIVTDTGWKISLDRGLDIYQPYEMNDAFALANRLQQYRSCKAFEITYLKTEA
ncbi:MAG: BREX system Lon protease-like protein BrxL [Pontiella sp.]